MRLSFRKPSRRTLIEIGVTVVVSYFGFYIFLRWDGEIVRHGGSTGFSVRARPGEWDDIALSMAESAPRFGWALGPMERLRQSRVEVWNILFFPLRKAEELFWNIVPRM